MRFWKAVLRLSPGWSWLKRLVMSRARCSSTCLVSFPHLEKLIGSRIGDTNLRVDVHGDALGVAILPGDRWRRSHGALKHRIYPDGRALGVDVQMEVCSLFTHYHGHEGQQTYEKLSRRQRSQQKIVPDLTPSNHIKGSVLQTPGLQMHEIKRIQSILSSNRNTGMSTGLNGL